MSNKKTIEYECDGCSRLERGFMRKTTGSQSIPIGWYQLKSMDLAFHRELISHYAHLKVIDETDPDFCSQKCLFSWFEKKLKKLRVEKTKKTPKEELKEWE